MTHTFTCKNVYKLTCLLACKLASYVEYPMVTRRFELTNVSFQYKVVGTKQFIEGYIYHE